MTEVNILGTEYKILLLEKTEDRFLCDIECDGYCDCTSRRIIVRKLTEGVDTADDFDEHEKRIMRHEIIHAFLYESGLGDELKSENGHSELYVDWFARQSRKIFGAFEEVGCQ